MAGNFFYDIKGCAIRAGDSRNIRLDNSRLVASNIFQIAQNIFVVKGNVRYDRQFRRDNIRGIKRAAQTDFDNGNIDSANFKIQEGGGGQSLKMRAGHIAIFNAENHFGKISFGNVFTVNFDSFAITF